MMEQLEELYSNKGVYGSLTYGSPFICKGLKCAAHLTQFGDFKGKKILCVGSGNGYEAVWFTKQGCDVVLLEMYHPYLKILKGKQVKGYAQDLPFKENEFDLYFCCEMMEHVPEEYTPPILKEARRVSRNVFFTIADTDDPPYHTHINLHNFTYWYSLFKEHGFEILNAQHCARLPVITDGQVILSAWADGIMIYAKC